MFELHGVETEGQGVQEVGYWSCRFWGFKLLRL